MVVSTGRNFYPKKGGKAMGSTPMPPEPKSMIVKKRTGESSLANKIRGN
jgi:hypothetical protein